MRGDQKETADNRHDRRGREAHLGVSCCIGHDGRAAPGTIGRSSRRRQCIGSAQVGESAADQDADDAEESGSEDPTLPVTAIALDENATRERNDDQGHQCVSRWMGPDLAEGGQREKEERRE